MPSMVPVAGPFGAVEADSVPTITTRLKALLKTLTQTLAAPTLVWATSKKRALPVWDIPSKREDLVFPSQANSMVTVKE